MLRLPRFQASGCTVHMVGRYNNRECCFTRPEGFHGGMAHLGAMARTYAVALYGYPLSAGRVCSRASIGGAANALMPTRSEMWNSLRNRGVRGSGRASGEALACRLWLIPEKSGCLADGIDARLAPIGSSCCEIDQTVVMEGANFS
jgi:hypothetical protein